MLTERFGSEAEGPTTYEENDVIWIDAPDLLLRSSIERDEPGVLFISRFVENVPSSDPVDGRVRDQDR